MSSLSSLAPLPTVANADTSIEQGVADLAVTHYLVSGGELPHAFTCPILHTLMIDPVSTRYATYERTAIERHLSHASTDPLTGTRLASTALMPNQSVKTLISEFLVRLQHRDPEAGAGV